MSGVAIAAALLVLQQHPQSGDSSRVRDYVTIGGTAMAGYFDVLTRSGVRLVLRRQHDQRMAGVNVGWRHEGRSLGIGIRGKIFTGYDNALPREAVSGFIAVADIGIAEKTPLSGGSAMLDVDGKYFGVTGGIVAGSLLKNRGNHTESIPSPIGAAAVRIGVLSRFYGEAAVYDNDPAPLPGAQLKLSATFVDDRGSRYRVGFVDTGKFAEFHVRLKYGLEVAPLITVGNNSTFNFRLGVEWRVPVRR